MPVLRIGTRRSRLAMAQAAEVAHLLDALGVESLTVAIDTAGDRGATVDRSAAGLKGLFVAEIIRALQEGRVDLAVHSAKDMPGEDPEGVIVSAVPERADPHDVLVTRDERLPAGSTVGTSSLRRVAQLARHRPQLRPIPLRGNVDTRLAKLEAGEVGALVLAAAGLKRLGVEPAHWAALGFEEMMPAPGQGALAVQARADDEETLGLVKQLDHPVSRAAFVAERALMVALGGGCALPLGALAEPHIEGVILRAVVASPDGRDFVTAKGIGPPAAAAQTVAARLQEAGAGSILAAVRGE